MRAVVEPIGAVGSRKTKSQRAKGCQGGGEGESVVLSSILEGETSKVQYCRQVGTPGGRKCRTVVDFCLPWGSPGGVPIRTACATLLGGSILTPPKSVAQAVRIEHDIEKVPYRPHGFRGQSEHAESTAQATTLSSGEPFKVDLGWVVR